MTSATGLDSKLERRSALAVLVVAIALFCGFLVLLPPRPPGFDEAKYLGIGLNAFEGRGPVTVFGEFFEPHSPLWPMTVAAPQVLLGVDGYAWAHFLNIVAAGALLALAGWLGWRVRPAVGAFGVAACLAFAYLFELSRRIGLDLPIAALSLSYLVLGGEAARRGSVRWGAAAGALFAVAFLVKESVLVFAPAPFLAGLAAGRPVASLARVGAATLATAAIGTTPWWWIYADATGRVFRLGTPAWTLAPIAIVVLTAVSIGLVAPPLAQRWPEWAPRRPAVGRRAIAFLLAAAWALMLALLLSRAGELLGAGLVDPAQFAFYSDRFLDELRLPLALGGIGAAIYLLSCLVGCRPQNQALDDLWLATVCGLPLVWLVFGVGDPPRHYVAQLVALILIGSGAWIWLVERALERPRRGPTIALGVAAGAATLLLAPLVSHRPLLITMLAAVGVLVAVAGLLVTHGRDRRAYPQAWAAGGGAAAFLVVLALVVSVGALGTRLVNSRASALDEAQSEAVMATATWLRVEVAAGTVVAFGASLGHEIAVLVRGTFGAVQVREEQQIVFDVHAPLGLVERGVEPSMAWIAVTGSPRIERAFHGYRADNLIADLRGAAADIWVLVEVTDFEDLPIHRALLPEHGFTLRNARTYGRFTVRIYQVDRDALAFDDSIWMTEAGLARLVKLLENADRAGAPAAQALARRVRLQPQSPRGDALLGRLRQLADR